MPTSLGKYVKRKLRERRGAAIALVALCMVALLSAVALAVDGGMLLTARTEAQTLADAAAMAGAGALIQNQGDSAIAAQAAAAFGSANNTVRGEHVPILPEDVEVIVDEWTVRVNVRRTADRGNAVPTFFARVFGVNQVNVTADAAAWAVTSSTIGEEDNPTCPALPLALLDKYVESNGDPGWQPGEQIEGWTADDHGTLVRLKQKPNAGSEPPPVSNSIDYCQESSNSSSWRCWWRQEEEAPNTGNVSDKIRGDNCTDPVSLGDDVFNAAGNMQANVIHDFRWLMEQDPDLEWCENCAENGCVVESPGQECFAGTSPRVRTVPIVDPLTINGTGSGINAHVIGFMGVFVERVAEHWADSGDGPPGKQNVYLRLINASGTGSGSEDGEDDPENFVRTIQLIE